MSIETAEDDARWWFECRGGDLGRSSQRYDFDAPRSQAVDTWEALAKLVNPRQRKAVQRDYRQHPVMSELYRCHPHEASVLEAVYSPHAYPDTLKAVRLAMSMSGARHMVTVIALVPASQRLARARAIKGREGESMLDYLAWEVSSQNSTLVRSVRSELTAMLDRALSVYGEVRSRHGTAEPVRKADRQSYEDYINGESVEAAE